CRQGLDGRVTQTNLPAHGIEVERPSLDAVQGDIPADARRRQRPVVRNAAKHDFARHGPQILDSRRVGGGDGAADAAKADAALDAVDPDATRDGVDVERNIRRHADAVVDGYAVAAPPRRVIRANVHAPGLVVDHDSDAVEIAAAASLRRIDGHLVAAR